MGDQVRQFLARVLPAPVVGAGLCLALAKPNGFLHALCGSIDDAAAQVAAWRDRGSVYACMSIQRMAEPVIGGAGVRSHATAVALRSLWLDIDCRTAAHGGATYASEDEALNAVVGAVRDTPGMPMFTLAVASGNGLHVYWTLDRALEPDQWHPLALSLAAWARARGVAADVGCTVDRARVLRVPGTLNFKTTPPAQCSIVLDTGRDVSADAVRAVLPAATPNRAPLRPRVVPVQFDDELRDDPEADLDLDLVARVCPLLGHAAKTGGAGHDYHAWLPMVWGAAFIERAKPGVGRAWAHALSRGHEDYTPEVVDRALSAAIDKLNSGRADFGWPTCATFACGTIVEGGRARGACDGCRFAGQGFGPFSLARRVQFLIAAEAASAPPDPVSDDEAVGIEVAPPPGPPTPPGGAAANLPPPGGAAANLPPPGGAAANLPPPCDDLPPPYERRQRSHGTKNEASVWKPPAGKGPWIEVLPFDVRKARLFSFSTPAHDFLEFEVRPGGQTPPRSVQLSVSVVQRGLAEFRSAIAGLPGGLTTPKDTEARGFIMAWINHLRTHANVYTSGEPPAPYGWVRKGGDTLVGFAFDNVVYTAAGAQRGYALNPLGSVYCPSGTASAWHDAVRLVLEQKRPGLATIVAAGFAGPLLSLLGIKGTVCSAYSAASGVGKTSAMRVAQAIWGQPTLGMQSLSDTEAALLKKAGLLRNLPLFWDELKSRHDLARFASAVFQLTHGREKSRATQTGSLAEVVEWDTLLLVAGNDCLVDVMLGQHTNTQAGALRVFEWEVEGDRLEGRAVLDAAAVFKRLDYSYGTIGQQYAEFLGKNIPLVQQTLNSVKRQLDAMLSPTSDERFWVGAASALVAGAVLAERAKLCTFDLTALLDHVTATFLGLRERLSEEKHYSDPQESGGLANLLAEFFADHADRILITPFMLRPSRGRLAKALEANPLFQVKNKDLLTIKSTQPVAHFACDERVLVVATPVLAGWLRDKKRLAIKAFLERFPGSGSRKNRVLGLGTDFTRRVQADTVELDLSQCVEPVFSFDTTPMGKNVLADYARSAFKLGQHEAARKCVAHYGLVRALPDEASEMADTAASDDNVVKLPTFDGDRNDGRTTDTAPADAGR